MFANGCVPADVSDDKFDVAVSLIVVEANDVVSTKVLWGVYYFSREVAIEVHGWEKDEDSFLLDDVALVWCEC